MSKPAKSKSKKKATKAVKAVKKTAKSAVKAKPAKTSTKKDEKRDPKAPYGWCKDGVTPKKKPGGPRPAESYKKGYKPIAKAKATPKKAAKVKK